jgi:glutaredoxin 3
MTKVLMYGTRNCSYCRMAEKLLDKKGVQLKKVMVDDDRARRDEMIQLTGRISVPQIIIDDKHVGGYQELAALEHSGRLDALLKIKP